MTSETVLAPAANEADYLREQLARSQRLASVGALASSVAHEVNNALTTILNAAKLGLRDRTDAGRTQALERIQRSSQRAAGIVHGMLGLARTGPSRPDVCDLAGIVEEAMTLTAKDLSAHRIQVECRIHDRPSIVAVAGQIEQIVVNLILNARQAMRNGGRLTVDVRANVAAGMAEVRVSDTGVGIPPERLRQIFEPFYTTKEPDSSGHGGTGLGLSVCRQIVEAHHGRIRVESVVGRGSAFTVKLPLDEKE